MSPRAVRAERIGIGTARVEALSTWQSPGPSSAQHVDQGKNQHAAGGAVRARAFAAAGGVRVRVELDHNASVVLAGGPDVAACHAAVLGEARFRGSPVEGRSNVAALKYAHCDPGSTFVRCAGG